MPSSGISREILHAGPRAGLCERTHIHVASTIAPVQAACQISGWNHLCIQLLVSFFGSAVCLLRKPYMVGRARGTDALCQTRTSAEARIHKLQCLLTRRLRPQLSRHPHLVLRPSIEGKQDTVKHLPYGNIAFAAHRVAF